MKRRTASRRLLSTSALTMSTRMVWPLSEAASLPRAMMRILPSRSSCRPNGGADQPMSTWPVITWVKVPGGPPVAVGLALTPRSLTKASTVLWEVEPLVEKAIVFLSVASLSDLIGESARTYQ